MSHTVLKLYLNHCNKKKIAIQNLESWSSYTVRISVTPNPKPVVPFRIKELIGSTVRSRYIVLIRLQKESSSLRSIHLVTFLFLSDQQLSLAS